MESINIVSLSGRLTADAFTNESKSFARFTIAHNFAKDKVVYPDFVMFAKNGKFEKKIPFDLLKKGAAVKVNAYFYPDTDKEGKPNGYKFVVKTVEPLTKEEEAAEDAAAKADAE